MLRSSVDTLLLLCQCLSFASASTNIFAFGGGIPADSVLRFDPTGYTSSDAHLAQVTTITDIETTFELYYWDVNSTGLFNRNYYAHAGSESQGQIVFLPYNQALAIPGPAVPGIGLGWSVASDGTVSVAVNTGFGPEQPQQFFACSNTTAPEDSSTYLSGQYLAIRGVGQSDPGCTPITLSINAQGTNGTTSSSSALTVPTTASSIASANFTSVVYANTTGPATTTTYPGPYTTVQPIEYTLTTAATATTIATVISPGGVAISPVGTGNSVNPGGPVISVTTTAVTPPAQTAMTVTTIVPGQSGPMTLTTVIPVQAGSTSTNSAAAAGQSNTVPVQNTNAGTQIGINVVLPLLSMAAVSFAML